MGKMLSSLTFEKDDELKRKKYAENATQSLMDSDINVVCVNSEWGTGKTWFVHMWINMIKNEEQYTEEIIPVYYNAWENDDFENAFVPLIGEINAQLFSNQTGDTVKKLKRAAGALMKEGLINAGKKFTGGIVDLSVAIEAYNDEEIFKKYETEFKIYREARSSFSEQLQQFTREANRKLFIFVDELDRCRSTFAIETLERMKHYFDVENVYFILLLDKTQLSHSVKVLYGSDCDTSGYLMRFIDVEYNMPVNVGDKYYMFKFKPKTDFEITLVELSKLFTLSLRDLDKLVIWVELFVKNSRLTRFSYLHKGIQYFLAYFLLLKLKYPSFYNDLFDDSKQKNISYNDIPYVTGVTNMSKSNAGINIIRVFAQVYNVRFKEPVNWGEATMNDEEKEMCEIEKLKQVVLSIQGRLSFLEEYKDNK